MKKPFNGDRTKDEKILEMYYHGHTYDQIAKELHVAPNHIASKRKDIIQLSKDYFTIPDVKSELENLLADVKDRKTNGSSTYQIGKS